MKLNKLITVTISLALSISLYADTAIDKTEPIVKKEITKPQVVKQTNNFYIGLSTGLSTLSSSKKDKVGTITLGKEVDEQGYNISWYLGYNYNKNSFSDLSGTYIKYDDIKLYNYLLSYNYKFLENNSLKPYIGILGGISFIELTSSHINSPLLDDKGSKFAYGAQLGLEYDISKNFVFFTQYQYLKANHTTKLESTPAISEILRDDYGNFSVGVRFGF